MNKKVLLFMLILAVLSVVNTVMADPVSGGQLVVAFGANAEPPSLDGQIASSQVAWVVDSWIADPLLVWLPDGTYGGGLAESYEANADNTEHVFHLKQGLVFQDGSPVNAEAVKFNFDRLADPNTASMNFADALGASVYTVEAVDEYTVKITYPTPWPQFQNVIRRYPIWSKEAVEKYGSDYAAHLTGHGPFKFVEYVANDHILLERWEEYPGTNAFQDHEGPAYLDSVYVRFIGEQSVLGMMVKTGDAHVAVNIPIQYAKEYEDESVGKAVVYPTIGGGMAWIINTSRAPLDILEARQALLYGLDRELANEMVYDGLYPLVYGPLTSNHPCFEPAVKDYYPHDPEKAKELLAGIGWEDIDNDGILEANGVPGMNDGDEFEINIYSYTDRYTNIMEELQLQLSEIGVNLKVNVIPNPVQFEKVTSGDFEIMINYSVEADPIIMRDMWYSKYAGEPGRWSWSRLAVPELDEVLEGIANSGDIEERCELAKKAQLLVMDNAGCLPVVDMPITIAYSNAAKEIVSAPEGMYMYLNNAYLGD